MQGDDVVAAPDRPVGIVIVGQGIEIIKKEDVKGRDERSWLQMSCNPTSLIVFPALAPSDDESREGSGSVLRIAERIL